VKNNDIIARPTTYLTYFISALNLSEIYGRPITNPKKGGIRVWSAPIYLIRIPFLWKGL
jgi:hypothetical protein